jgi:pimeloyl-ACP methyl ester carboxylesterase
MPQIPLPGVTLNVVDQGQGTPLLLVHGFPLDHTMWRGQIDAFSSPCRVIAPDLRGFGASSVTPGTVSMAQFADDLAALLAALDTAEAAANRLKLAEKALQDGAGVVAEAMLPKLFANATPQEQPQVVQSTRQVMLRTKPQGIAAALRGMAERADSTDLLAKIDLPALVIVGQEDAISTVDEMRSLAAAIRGAVFVDIPSAGHMAPLERPGAANEALERFLASVR